jgi:tRNA:m(5)U-54 methyltransferase
MSVCWFQSRYDKVGPGGTGKDYINCPMDKDQYDAFIDALIAGDTTGFKEWEGTPYFDGCLPIEIMAERGRETLRHGPMKPMGLTNAHKPDIKPYAVVQLRQDNALGTLYNMVGFQTKLKYGAQADIFRMIPGLENAEFARLGGLHRNTYLNSPLLLDAPCSSRAARACALPARSPAAKAMSKARPSGCSPAASPQPSALATSGSVPPRQRPSARCSTTSPAATSSATMNLASARSSR